MAGAGIQSLAKFRAQMCVADCGNPRRLEHGLPRIELRIATDRSINLRVDCHRLDRGNLRAERGNPQSTCERFAKKLVLLWQSASFDRGT
jgi:hypothetical protein